MDAFGSGGAFGSQPPPKKKIPAKVVPKQKEEEEKVASGDADMNDDEDAFAKPKAAPVKPKPKPELKAKPSTTAAVGKPKGSSGPQIQEEDVGVGLSKEEAEAKVSEFFSAENVAKMEEAKWQDKVEGIKGLGAEVEELKPTADVVEGLAKFIKTRLKEWKESNLNMIKETIALFTKVSLSCEKVNKRSVACIMPFLVDKIGDSKYMAGVQELIINLAELVSPKFMAL